MTGEIKLTGIVLSSMPIGDYDRRISILTGEKGRISAFVRNARRPMSSMRAASMPFTYGNFSIYANRDSYTVNGCEDTVFFDDLSKDIEKTYYGWYFCELMSYFTRENSEEREQVKLLFTAFKALQKGRIRPDFIRRIFELRALANFGEAPNVFECADCRNKTKSDKWFLDIRQGAVFCKTCSKDRGLNEDENHILISETVRYAMHYCIGSPYKSLFSFELVPDMENMFKKAVEKVMKFRIDKPLKTLELLDGIGI